MHNYGWHPDTPDHRDQQWRPPATLGATPPSMVDLSGAMPPIYDQGQLGSCTANAIAGLMQYTQMREGLPDYTPSRLFIYYEERKREGTIASDAGAMIRDGMKVVAKLGAPPETEWPYDIARFTEHPPVQCYYDATGDRALSYARVPRPSLKAALAANHPVVIGFSVYESFETSAVALTGDAPMPALGEDLLGGHAVLLCGYDDRTGRWLLRNSWGVDWGNHGYFTLPYQYLIQSSLSNDFWTITKV